MISSFAAYLLLVSILFAAGGWASEQAFLVRHWPRRFLWLATLCASVLFPLGMALSTAAPQTRVSPPKPLVQLDFLVPGATQHTQTSQPQPVPAQLAPAAPPAPPAVPRSPAASSPVHLSWDLIAAGIWLSTSSATALFYLLTGIRLARAVRCAPCATVQGVPVRLTPAGPAVFGILRPKILWPRWLNEAPAATQAAAIAHETQHLAVRDPLLLAAGLFLVVLAAWNPALWWQLRRMRFAMEADCDWRVVRAGTDANVYALALLHIAQSRAAAGTGLAVLMSTPSWLERRVSILLHSRARRRLLLAAVGIPLALGAWLAVVQLPAPVLRLRFSSAELRMLPPQDMRPGADWARQLARSRYPGLFNRHFDGTAAVVAIFNRDGTPKLTDMHLSGPGMPPSDLDMEIENQRAGVDPRLDVFYAGLERGQHTIGPWLEGLNAGRVFVVYEVLKWDPDHSRTPARAEAALKAASPELFTPVEPDTPREGLFQQVTLLMNDDGTIGRRSQRAAELRDDTPVERFEAMGISKERLGRGGTFSVARALVDFAWPRRPDDPPGLWHSPVDMQDQELWPGWPSGRPSREDTDDVARIKDRYFPDAETYDAAALNEILSGERTSRIGWILFGRDGHVWDAGYLPWFGAQYSSFAEVIQYRYPGTRIEASFGMMLPGSQRVRVPVVTAWIAAGSPVQRKSDLDLSQRKDVLLTGGLAMACVMSPGLDDAGVSSGKPRSSLVACGPEGSLGGEVREQVHLRRSVAAADLGVPVRMAWSSGPVINPQTGQEEVLPPGFGLEPIEVTVRQAAPQRLLITVRAPQSLPSAADPAAGSGDALLAAQSGGDPASWTQIVRTEARYGQLTTVELRGDSAGQTTRFVLRVDPLKQ